MHTKSMGKGIAIIGNWMDRHVGFVSILQKDEVSSAPTLVFFKDGKEIQRLTGVQKKADLEKFISENV